MQSLNGVLALDKPSGLSSAAVVREVRRILPQRVAIGHAGTLDPLAQGVLPILCGTATRLQDMLHELPKTYTVTAEFGYETDTLDSEGEVVARTECLPTETAIQRGCQEFTGDIVQIPPLYSAIKLHGKPLYYYARQGLALPVALPDLARAVRIFNFVLLHMRGRQAVLRVTSTRGTYVRSLVRDLAQRLGSLATVTALVREESAGLQRSNCVVLAALTAENFATHLIAIAQLPLPQLRVADAVTCTRLQNGQMLPCPVQLFTQPRKKFLLADKIGEVFGIGTQQDDGTLRMIRGLTATVL